MFTPRDSSLCLKVGAVASNLNSNDAFVLVSPSGSVLWAGHGTSDAEKNGAQQLGDLLGVELSEMAEGEEGGMSNTLKPSFAPLLLQCLLFELNLIVLSSRFVYHAKYGCSY